MKELETSISLSEIMEMEKFASQHCENPFDYIDLKIQKGPVVDTFVVSSGQDNEELLGLYAQTTTNKMLCEALYNLVVLMNIDGNGRLTYPNRTLYNNSKSVLTRYMAENGINDG